MDEVIGGIEVGRFRKRIDQVLALDEKGRNDLMKEIEATSLEEKARHYALYKLMVDSPEELALLEITPQTPSAEKHFRLLALSYYQMRDDEVDRGMVVS